MRHSTQFNTAKGSRTLPPMCGIAGIIRVQRGGDAAPAVMAVPEAWLDTLDESVRHRGPDGHGRCRARAVRADGAIVDVALTHRRLAILDHGGGHQPMVMCGGGNVEIPSAGDARAYERTRDRALRGCAACGGAESSDIAVVFNGCIYNHRDLRRDLERLGHAFTTDHSDTEVLIHGWRQWGPSLFDRVISMHAIAIWDGRDGTLTLARDRFGEKPLYVCGMGQPDGVACVAFASSCAGLWRWLRDVGANISGDVLASGLEPWLRFGFGSDPPGSWIRAVVPAASLTLPDMKVGWRSHGWRQENGRIVMPRRDERLTPGDAEILLTRAVEARLESDVPLGCFLSGGVDSSLIAAIARRKLGSLRTFTVRMPDARYDESAHAEKVAGVLRADHATLECHADPAADLVHLITQLGLPFGDSSLLPTHWVSRAARQHVTVALSGDGGDELFVGYDRYLAAASMPTSFRLLPSGSFRLLPTGLLPRHDPKALSTRAARFIESAGGLGYIDLVSIFPTRALRRIAPRVTPAQPHWAIHGTNNAIVWDVFNYLPNDLLRKTDAASMSVALEVRCPFLDPMLAHACLSAPFSDLMPHGQRKEMLRAIARIHLPGCDVDRPKQGFAIPIGEWFRSDYGKMRQLLLDHLTGHEPFGPDSLGINALIDMKVVHRLLREHDAAGNASRWQWRGRDHSQRLYLLLVLSIWSKWLAG